MGSKKITVVLTLAVLSAGLWAFVTMAAWSSRGGQSAPLYSTHRYDPYGTAALLEILKVRRVDAAGHEHVRMREGQSGVLIQVLPEKHYGGPAMDAESLRDWIADGNMVIQFTSHNSQLMAECGVIAKDEVSVGYDVKSGAELQALRLSSLEQKSTWETFEEEMARGVAPEMVGWDEVWCTWQSAGWQELGAGPMARGLVVRSPLKLPGGTGIWRALAKTSMGSVTAGICTVGKGRLIVVGSPSPMLNSELAKGGNVDFVLAAVGERRVWVDEWSHGIGTGGTVMGVIREVGMLPVLVQLIFFVAVYAWSHLGARLRDVTERERRRACHEQVLTLGYLFESTLSAWEMRKRVHDEVHRRVAKVYRCSPALLPLRIEAKRGNEKMTAEAVALLKGSPPMGGRARPVCPQCQYDLRGSKGEACPECGRQIDVLLRGVIERAGLGDVKDEGEAPSKIEGEMAYLLSKSHKFVMEHSRDRSNKRQS